MCDPVSGNPDFAWSNVAGCQARAVAQLAGLREPAANVIWIGRSLEVLQVARYACRSSEVVVVVDVAVGALPRRNGVSPVNAKFTIE